MSDSLNGLNKHRPLGPKMSEPTTNRESESEIRNAKVRNTADKLEKELDKKPKLSDYVTKVEPGANALLENYNRLSNRDLERNNFDQQFTDSVEKLEKAEIERLTDIAGENPEHLTPLDQNGRKYINQLGAILALSSEIITSKKYYIDNLKRAIVSREENENEFFKLYRDHFFQTAQSLIFLRGIEKISESMLVEKIVYLPPNKQSKPILKKKKKL